MIVNFEGKDQIIPPIMQAYDASGKGTYKFDPRKYIDLAYAITTHKSQGSEFKKIVVLMHKSRVLNKANFYTAITRAKLHVTCICGPGGLSAAMQPYKQEKDAGR
jgi:ATP-dependent exoDNAse (exonuclease V) alpha subunit